MKELGKVQSYLFDDHVIVSFDKEWINLFGGLPVFSITIDDAGKLCLQSQKVRRDCE
jgi:hypothetical protein